MLIRIFAIAFALIFNVAIGQEVSVQFTEVTEEVGLISSPSWKYGGPCVADLNNDGIYDLLLGNHDKAPVQLLWGKRDHSFVQDENLFQKWDVHGIAAGDYDLDGDMDVVVSMGGGNGKNPKPPRLKRNDNGDFVDVTDEAGIAEMGARGRAPRWIDVNADGYLDLLHINAAQADGEKGPRNIIFRNNGNGTFSWQRSPELEKADAERVLVTDFNADHIPDLILFTAVGKIPFTVWQGNSNFVFRNVTDQWLGPSLSKTNEINAICETDFDNDGDLDYYLARGQTYYKTANNAFSFDETLKRLDLRDEGNKGHDGIGFSASDEITLQDFFHWKRGPKNITLPVYLGKSKTRINTPTKAKTIKSTDATGFPDSTTENGWYLGYLGGGKWRLEWNLSDNLAWDIRASIVGVEKVHSDWKPRQLGIPDVLLRNEGDRFSDASHMLPAESKDNNWGVVGGDFNNDGFSDFFIYRFGEMIFRTPDALLINRGGKSFASYLDHGANKLPEKSHGDMGAAFDYDRDGNVDLLSGDDDYGRWRLFKNDGIGAGNWFSIHVAYSNSGIDPLGAEVEIETDSGKQFKRVGASSASHSQSTLNNCHFGIGKNHKINEVTVRWRDGTIFKRKNQKANRILTAGRIPINLANTKSSNKTSPAGPYFADVSQDPKPNNKVWKAVSEVSDEFDGNKIDSQKWQTEPLENGWGWLGRAPGLFRAENVMVRDGNMNVTVSVLPEPQTIRKKEWLYQGAIVRSQKPCQHGWYLETRMKANKTAMSSTFWLMTKDGTKHRQELDIQECVGFTSELTQKWGRNWNQIFHSNLIRTERGVPGKVQIQNFLIPPTPNYERFYVYGAWWKSPREVQFFFDGKYAYSLKPDVDWDMEAFIQMAIETYDWNPVPEGGGLIRTGTWEERTTKYDWVRVWKLEDR